MNLAFFIIKYNDKIFIFQNVIIVLKFQIITFLNNRNI